MALAPTLKPVTVSATYDRPIHMETSVSVLALVADCRAWRQRFQQASNVECRELGVLFAAERALEGVVDLEALTSQANLSVKAEG